MLARWCTGAAVSYSLLMLVIGQEYDEPYTNADKDRLKSFWDSRLEIDPCCDVTLEEPREITVWFRTDGTFSDQITLYVDLPRLTTGTLASEFSDAASINLGELDVSPSTLWDGAWEQGTYDDASPFETSRLKMTLKAGRTLTPGTEEVMFVRISNRNNIWAFCGWEEDTIDFRIYTDSDDVFDNMAIETSPRLGNGCRSDCYDRGVCDYCHEVCLCHEGQGDKNVDIVDSGGWTRLDCAEYVCPSGKAWTARAEHFDGGGRGLLENHALEECSGNGRCDRRDASCICAEGFEGDACQRNSCPSDCSAHGKCTSMYELGLNAEALPLTSGPNIYGGAGSDEALAWDFESMYACVCDSTWEVGLGPGQRQQAEYFGPDCSQRRCPTGDDPLTAGDDTDCEGVTADGGFGVGEEGNLCHVDCSHRGMCDYETGQCSCYDGFYGENCGKTTALAFDPLLQMPSEL